MCKPLNGTTIFSMELKKKCFCFSFKEWYSLCQFYSLWKYFCQATTQWRTLTNRSKGQWVGIGYPWYYGRYRWALEGLLKHCKCQQSKLFSAHTESVNVMDCLKHFVILNISQVEKVRSQSWCSLFSVSLTSLSVTHSFQRQKLTLLNRYNSVWHLQVQPVLDTP